jgi:hypothetical protein
MLFGRLFFNNLKKPSWPSPRFSCSCEFYNTEGPFVHSDENVSSNSYILSTKSCKRCLRYRPTVLVVFVLVGALLQRAHKVIEFLRPTFSVCDKNSSGNAVMVAKMGLPSHAEGNSRGTQAQPVA